MVLVELSIEGRDLALAKRVIERLIDHLRRDPQPRSCLAIDHKRGGQSGRLLVGGYIAQLWQLFQLLDKALRPPVQFVRIRIFESVLKLSPAHTVFHR